MTAKEAAKIIGCSPQQVRTLIRTKKLRAKKEKTPWGSYCYTIKKREAICYRNKPQTSGYPRGQARK